LLAMTYTQPIVILISLPLSKSLVKSFINCTLELCQSRHDPAGS